MFTESARLVHPALPHLFEILEIVEGGVNLDRARVAAFTEQLAAKVAANGDNTQPSNSAGLSPTPEREN